MADQAPDLAAVPGEVIAVPIAAVTHPEHTAGHTEQLVEAQPAVIAHLAATEQRLAAIHSDSEQRITDRINQLEEHIRELRQTAAAAPVPLAPPEPEPEAALPEVDVLEPEPPPPATPAKERKRRHLV